GPVGDESERDDEAERQQVSRRESLREGHSRLADPARVGRASPDWQWMLPDRLVVELSIGIARSLIETSEPFGPALHEFCTADVFAVQAVWRPWPAGRREASSGAGRIVGRRL